MKGQNCVLPSGVNHIKELGSALDMDHPLLGRGSLLRSLQSKNRMADFRPCSRPEGPTGLSGAGVGAQGRFM